MAKTHARIKGNYKKISGILTEINAGKHDASTVKGWIRGFFKKEGVEITPRAVELIVELKGDDITGIKAELEKLLSFSGGERIDTPHVEDLVGRSVTETVFKLVDAINEGNAKWAWRVLNDLYDNKKRPQEILGYLGTYIRKIQKVKLLSYKGADTELVASEIGTRSSYYAQRMMREAKRYSVERIEEWTSALLEADRDMKTGKRNDRLAVEMLISTLMASSPQKSVVSRQTSAF